MTRAREVAQAAVDNVWLTLAQRAVTLVGVPLFIVAALSYMALRDRVTIAEAKLAVAEGNIMILQNAALALRADLSVQAGSVTRLQAQREGDAQLGERITELRGDVRALNSRLDQMMIPSRRGVP